MVDPGTFVYTPDAAERNRFRSTAWHSTLQVGDEEQNALRSDYLFAMEDRRRARALEWAPGDDGRAVFAGRHEGFPGATHERRFEFDGPAGTLTLHDTVQGADGRTLTWTFPLPPGARVRTAGGEAVAEIGGARLTIRGEGVDFTVEDGSYAPAYGVREPAPFVRGRRAGGGRSADHAERRAPVGAQRGPQQPVAGQRPEVGRREVGGEQPRELALRRSPAGPGSPAARAAAAGARAACRRAPAASASPSRMPGRRSAARARWPGAPGATSASSGPG